MKFRDGIFFIIGGVVAFVGCLVLYAALNSAPPSRPDAPTVAGQKVPAELISLNFTNRFTFYCSSSAPHRDFQSCKIIGFSSNTGEASGRGWSVSSGSLYFDYWIVLEDPDGHRFYVRPGDIQYIEDDTLTAVPATH